MPDTIRFPLDTKDVYQARIRFVPYKVEPIQFNATKFFQAPQFDNVRKLAGDVTRAVTGESTTTTADNQASPVGGYGFGAGVGSSQSNQPTGTKTRVTDEEFKSDITNLYTGPKPIIDSSYPIIETYVPVSLQFSDNIGYDNPNLGAMGTAAGAALAGNGDLVASAITGITQGMGNVFSFLTGALTGEAARVAASQGANMLPGGIKAAVQIGAQRIVNPNVKSLFRGVDIRQFTFQFKMIPTSKAEADAIDNIVRIFRKLSYPEAFDPTGTREDLPYALKFPHQFKIGFFLGNKRLRTQDIELCYLRNISTVYNASGGGYHADGSPTEIDLSLTFQETRTLTRADIDRQHGVTSTSAEGFKDLTDIDQAGRIRGGL